MVCFEGDAEKEGVVFDVAFTGALGEPEGVEAEGGELGVVDAYPSKVVVDLGDGIPQPGALKVVGNSVPGAVGGEGATETAWGVGQDAESGVGDPGVAPRFENRETA